MVWYPGILLHAVNCPPVTTGSCSESTENCWSLVVFVNKYCTWRYYPVELQGRWVPKTTLFWDYFAHWNKSPGSCAQHITAGSFFLVLMDCPDNGLRIWCQIFCQTQVWIVVTSLGQEKYKHLEPIGDWTFCILQRSFVMQKLLRDWFRRMPTCFWISHNTAHFFSHVMKWAICVVYRCSTVGFLNYEWVPYSCHYMHLNGKRLNILPCHCSCSS